MITWWLALGLSSMFALLIVLAAFEWRWRQNIEDTFWERRMTPKEMGALLACGKALAMSRARCLVHSFDRHLPKEDYIFMHNAVLATVNLLCMEAILAPLGWMPDTLSEQGMKKLVDRALKGAHKLADGHFWDTLIFLRGGLVATGRTDMWSEEYWRKLANALICNPRQEGIDGMRPHLWAMRREFPDIAEDMAERFAQMGNYAFLLDLYQDPEAIPQRHLETVSDCPKGKTPWADLLEVRKRLGQWDRIAASVGDISDDTMRGTYLDALRAVSQLQLLATQTGAS